MLQLLVKRSNQKRIAREMGAGEVAAPNILVIDRSAPCRREGRNGRLTARGHGDMIVPWRKVGA